MLTHLVHVSDVLASMQAVGLVDHEHVATRLLHDGGRALL
jgi:hypothetical protein